MFTAAALPVVYVKGSFVDGPCPVNLFLLFLPGRVLEPVGHDNPVLADVVLKLLALSHLKSHSRKHVSYKVPLSNST